jgi:esterase/lipase
VSDLIQPAAPAPPEAPPTVEAVLIHGFATTALDLRPLGEAFAAAGIACSYVELDGHDGRGDLATATVDGWLEQVDEAVCAAERNGRAVYLVGFSFGASLALRVAADHDVAGVLGISTFVAPRKPRLAKLALRFRRFPPVGTRRPRVSARQTRKELKWTPTIPTSAVAQVIERAPELSTIPRDRRVLLVHSVNDPVADYSAVVDAVQSATSDDVRLISLAGLAHFIQFDISPHALCRAALAHFDPSLEGPDVDSPSWVENVKQREEEVRHWANVLSVLFGGFLTLFGTLLRATLPDVTAHKPMAPYLLFGYALLVSGYLEFVFLYFFYMNRTQAYIRTYIDPLQEVGIGWTFYRTTRWASGRASRQMTRLVSASVMLIPLLFAVSSLCYAASTYHARLFAADTDDIWLKLLAIVSVFWLLQAVYTGAKLVRYTRTHLYRVPPIVPASREFLLALQEIYTSARPGAVRQSTRPPSTAPGADQELARPVPEAV